MVPSPMSLPMCTSLPSPLGAASAHVVEAVRIGRAHHRLVVGLAQGEGVGQGVVVGNVAALEVAHGFGVLHRHPLVVAALVPDRVEGRPFMVLRTHPLGAGDLGIPVIGGELVLVVLVPDRLAVLALERARVVEAADAVEVAEVVIEAAVLLHQDDHVLDVLDGSGADVRLDGQGARSVSGNSPERPARVAAWAPCLRKVRRRNFQFSVIVLFPGWFFDFHQSAYFLFRDD